MNNLKKLREENHLSPFELIEQLRKISPTITVIEWIEYEAKGIPQRRNDEFWQKIADFFEVDLGYLYGYTKIPNEDYIVELQEVLHHEYELKLENKKLEKNFKEALAENDAKDKRIAELENSLNYVIDELKGLITRNGANANER